MKLGKAFSDFVIEERRRAIQTKPPVRAWWQGTGRALFFATILIVTLCVLLWRLFTLTVVRGHEFRALAEGNRTREIIRHAPRGKLLDRSGAVLADTTLDAPSAGTRRYPAGAATAHVVGYTGEIREDELGEPYYSVRGYRLGDRVGRMGAEAVFEERLRGRDGRELVEVDALGQTIRTLGRIEEQAGEDVTLSIDRALSEAAERAFPADQKGAVVVTKPATGEVLVLYASPSFDPNIFSRSLSKETYEALFENPNLPMFHRAIAGVYPPGSTFKIVTAIAALEENAITERTLVDDVGELVIGRFRFPNWYFTQYGKTEGLLDVVKAIQRSNDIFFYKAGEAVGITALARWARAVGVGALLGIEIPGESGGLMPDPAWKAARNDRWYLGDTYHVAIGQGYLLTTPLQVNAWTNVVANGGKRCRPTIQKVPNTKLHTAHCNDLGIQQKTINVITEGMKRACEPGGTGWPFFNFQIPNPKTNAKTVTIPVACKTGTAEFGDPNGRTHAWFTAFAPIGEPEISVTVLVEGAGEGSDQAAPIAKKVLQEWFSR